MLHREEKKGFSLNQEEFFKNIKVILVFNGEWRTGRVFTN